jgi:hypothetical protein
MVHRHMDSVSVDTSVDIVLTPQFYTMKREALPVKYAFQAKKIAPSLFDGLVEPLHDHKYFVYKEGDAWIFIAYDPEEIARFLQKKSVTPEKTGRLFFAQQISDQLHAPIVLDDKNALALLEKTVVVVPRAALPQGSVMAADDITPPSKGVNIESSTASIFSRKQAIAASVILVMLGAIWLAEGWRYGKSNAVLEKKQAAFYEKYPALQSAYTRESIAEKYRTIDKAERKKRNIVGKVAGMIFKGVTLTRFEMDTKHFKASFVTKDSKVEKRLKALAGKAGFTSVVKGKEIIVKGSV